jgi:DNA-binding response OmpR family regulator
MLWSNKKKILLIEDDIDLSEMYRMRFAASGFDVKTASDGQKGMEEMKKYNPDLVLLDIVMPKKDGFDLLEEIQESANGDGIKKIPIVILSNLASPIDIMEGKRLGAKDWWIKAFNTPTQITQKVIEFFKK